MRPTILIASLGTLLLLGPSVGRADDPDGVKPTGTESAMEAPKATPAPAEAERITIQHVLIGFLGSVPGKTVTRTMEEARTLAHQVLERARKGEDFDALVKQYTDDAAPGIYSLANNGVTPNEGEYRRSNMVPAFGDAGFPLKVGELGIAEYDKARSPYGWHVVKRIK